MRGSEVGRLRGAKATSANAKAFAERMRGVFDELADLPASAAARELERRGYATPRGGKWSAIHVVSDSRPLGGLVMTAKSGRSSRSTKPPAKHPVDLLLVSAVTFLTLCVWIGPSRTLLFLMIAAALVVWFWLIRRFPRRRRRPPGLPSRTAWPVEPRRSPQGLYKS